MEKEEKRMLEKIDLTKKMEKEEYEKRMKQLEPELEGFSGNAGNGRFR